MKLPILLSALSIVPAAAVTVATGTFGTASTEGWSAAGSTALTSNIADAGFGASSPVLRAVSTGGAGNNTRASLSFPTITLANVGDFLQIDFRIRAATSMASADRRFQTAFWDSTTADGYVSYMKAGSTGTFSSTFVETTALPATGILNSGGSNLASTGATTNSFGTGTTAVHTVTYLITATATGVNLSFSATDDSGTLRTFTASDNSGAFLTFDRFDLTFWGNTVNFNIDSVAVATSVPEPAATLLGGLGLLALLRRRR